MASFDVIDAAQHGYRQLWAERAYLMRLAMVPIFVKFICLVTAMTLDLGNNYIRHALIFLPDYFTEGWMLAHVVRLAFLGQRWPFRPTGDNAADELILRDRFRGVMAATLIYVLTRFIGAGALHFLLAADAAMTRSAEAEQLNGGVFLLALVTLIIMLWSVRLVWLYIPAALNFPARDYLRAVGRGLMPSFYMIGAWMVCTVPVIFIWKLLATFLIVLAGGPSAGVEFMIAALQAGTETTTKIIATFALGWGIAQMMAPPERRPPGRR